MGISQIFVKGNNNQQNYSSKEPQSGRSDFLVLAARRPYIRSAKAPQSLLGKIEYRAAMLKAPVHQVAGHNANEGALGPLGDDSGRFYKNLYRVKVVVLMSSPSTNPSSPIRESPLIFAATFRRSTAPRRWKLPMVLDCFRTSC